MRLFRFAIALAVLFLAAAPLSQALADSSAPLFSIVYSANDFGEYRPCPT